MLYPTFLDLHTHGESFSKVDSIFTEKSWYLDVFAKNFIGSFDTTKYGSNSNDLRGIISTATSNHLLLCKVDQVLRETFLFYTLGHSYFEFSFSIIRSPLARYARAKYVSSSILLDLFFDDYSDGRRSTKSNRGDHLDSF